MFSCSEIGFTTTHLSESEDIRTQQFIYPPVYAPTQLVADLCPNRVAHLEGEEGRSILYQFIYLPHTYLFIHLFMYPYLLPSFLRSFVP